MSTIAADLIRGHTETIILAQLMGGDSYGYQINKAVKQMTNAQYEFKEATLYSAFKRLEEEHYIRSYWGNEGSGARRRYYAITDEGRRHYTRLTEEWRRVSVMIETLISVTHSEQL